MEHFKHGTECSFYSKCKCSERSTHAESKPLCVFQTHAVPGSLGLSPVWTLKSRFKVQSLFSDEEADAQRGRRLSLPRALHPEPWSPAEGPGAAPDVTPALPLGSCSSCRVQTAAVQRGAAGNRGGVGHRSPQGARVGLLRGKRKVSRQPATGRFSARQPRGFFSATVCFSSCEFSVGSRSFEVWKRHSH